MKIRDVIDSYKTIGFLSPYVSINKKKREELLSFLSGTDKDYVSLFQDEISKCFGEGRTICFASGRMAFWAILQAIGVKEGDEVILTGATCSVMANAVLRTRACIKYADIDSETLGTSPFAVEKLLSSKTKVVVAQHTFGYPCRIDVIKEICLKNHVFLIEDCALALGSSYKGVKLGDWGDAAIFSTDHSKPLNSLIGGGMYTKNIDVYNKVKTIQSTSEDLTLEHQRQIIMTYISESDTYYSKWLPNLAKDTISWILGRLFGRKVVSFVPYLDCDSTANISKETKYPYPAKMPQIVAFLASISLKDYIKNIRQRKIYFEKIERIISSHESIPSILHSVDADICPLRLAFVLKTKTSEDFRFFKQSWIWFKEPVVSTNESLEGFGYHRGMCPVSEKIGESIMNIPYHLSASIQEEIIRNLKKIYNN